MSRRRPWTPCQAGSALRSIFRVASLLVLAILAGCGGEVDREENAAEATREIRLERRWSAGSVTAPGVVLSDVMDIAWSPTGVVAILEWGNGSIALLDSEGDPLTRLGGYGPGPSELMEPVDLGFRGDTLWVADQGTNSVKLWVLPDEFIESRAYRFGATSDEGGPNTVTGYLGGGVAIAKEYPPSDQAIADRVDTTEAYYSVSESDSVIAHLGVANLTHTKLALQNEGSRVGGFYSDQPIAGDPFYVHGGAENLVLYRIDRRTAATAGTDSFPVWRLNRTGEFRWKLQVAYYPVAFPPILRDSLIDVWGERAQESMGVQTASTSHARRLAREALFLPDYLPPVRTAAVSPSGRLWLEMWTAPASERRLLIVSPTGAVCARARVKTSLEFLAATERGILVGGNEGGVPTVEYFAAESNGAC